MVTAQLGGSRAPHPPPWLSSNTCPSPVDFVHPVVDGSQCLADHLCPQTGSFPRTVCVDLAGKPFLQLEGHQGQAVSYGGPSKVFKVSFPPTSPPPHQNTYSQGSTLRSIVYFSPHFYSSGLFEMQIRNRSCGPSIGWYQQFIPQKS